MEERLASESSKRQENARGRGSAGKEENRMKNVLVCIDLGGTAMKAGVFRKDEGLSEKCVLPVHQDFEGAFRGNHGIRRPDERKIYSLRRGVQRARSSGRPYRDHRGKERTALYPRPGLDRGVQ